MRMLKWMYNLTKDKIKNEIIHDKVRVTPIEDKMEQTQSKWFGHAKRRSIEAPARGDN